ncbi:hypothetical protein BDF19DRAFT_453939 [Syncephalis fuscata]|nr:hypothetical protein BDF19DRAFT_453939 [Syncephalis fuscata]
MTQELDQTSIVQAEAAVTKTATVTTTTTTQRFNEKVAHSNEIITGEQVISSTNVTTEVTVITKEEIAKDDKLYKQCLLFPTYAYWSSRVENGEGDAGEWTVKTNGWIFGFPRKSNRRRLALGIARVLGGLSTNDEHYTHFEQRTRMFFAVDTPDEPVRIQAIGVTTPEKFELDGDPADHIYSEGCGDDCDDDKSDTSSNDEKLPLPPRPATPDNAPSMELLADSGYLRGHLRVDGDLVKQWHNSSESGKERTLLKLRAFFAGEPQTPTYGVVNLISPHGISVISDIDDTIKMTGILHGVKTVLGNTFFKKTTDVPGMASVYNEWYKRGVAFHYVSNGPWQLYPMLDQFFREHQFPPGAAHLRMYDGISAVLQDVPGQTKQDRIIDIFNDFPHRRFILVGDSGEKDPEVYADIAKRFPDRVVCIFIHDVTTPMLLDQVQIKMETAVGKTTSRSSSPTADGAAVQKKDGESDVEKENDFGQRIRSRLSKLKEQFHKDLHEGSETVADLFDWADDKVDDAQNDLNVKIDELAEHSRKALLEFRKRIHDVFDGLKDWRLFMDAKEMLSHEKVHTVFDKPSVAQAEAQEPATQADPIQ